MILRFILAAILLVSASITQSVALAAPPPPAGPQFNVRIHPLHILVDSFGADLEFKGGDNWSVGPSLAFWSKDKGASFKSRASLIAARGMYTFDHDRFSDGWYVGPFLGFASIEVEKIGPFAAQGKGSGNGLVLGSYGGHQWFWNEFSVNVGAGLALSSAGDVSVDYITSGTSEKVDSETIGGFIWEVGLNYAW
jgi:hypothetical protein